MPESSTIPFELHRHGPSGFVVFETAESVALPLHTLAKATLRGRGANLVLQFGASSVVVDGEGLGVVFEHLLAAELKLIRCGGDQGVAVRKIQILDAET